MRAFVNERVKSYPAIATSDAVLDSAMARLGMDSRSSEPWVEVEATSPVETAQVDITVESSDAELAANVANAVACPPSQPRPFPSTYSPWAPWPASSWDCPQPSSAAR